MSESHDRGRTPAGGDLHSALEEPEAAGYDDFFAAAPPALAARHGVASGRVGPVGWVAVASQPGMRLLNHALGLGRAADAAATLVEVEAIYAQLGVPTLVAVPARSPVEVLLHARGYVRDYAWVKFRRDCAPPAPVTTDLRIAAVAPGDAGAMGALAAEGFGLPADMAPWIAALAGRPRWHCLGAYDGERLVACGAMFIHASTGWLTWAATHPEQRGRGAQKALLAARIDLARAMRLRSLVTETGEQVAGRPDASYRNIIAAGFQPVHRRPFWRQPARATAEP